MTRAIAPTIGTFHFGFSKVFRRFTSWPASSALTSSATCFAISPRSAGAVPPVATICFTRSSTRLRIFAAMISWRSNALGVSNV